MAVDDSAAYRASSELLIRGGRVVDATGERVADVLVRDGRVAEVGPTLAPARREWRRSTRAAASWRPASSTSTCTSASPAWKRRRRSRPARAPRRSAGSPRSSRCPTPSPRSTTPRSSTCGARARARAPCARSRRRAASRRAAPATRSRRWGSCTASACASSPTTATASPTRGVMRRALEYSRALPGAVVAQHAEDPGARGRRRDARRCVVEPARHPGSARGGRGRHRRPRRRSSPSSPARACTSCTCRLRARSSWCGPRRRAASRSPRRPRRTTSRSPTSAARRSTRCSRCTRRCADEPTSTAIRAGLADGTIDAIATDHAPHPARRRSDRSKRRRPGMLGLETALALTLTELVRPGLLTLARRAARCCSWRPAAIAGLAAPRAAGRARARRANLCVIDPDRAWVVDAGAAREQGPQHALRGAQAHRARAPHDAARRAGRRRRRGPAMNTRERRASC